MSILFLFFLVSLTAERAGFVETGQKLDRFKNTIYVC